MLLTKLNIFNSVINLDNSAKFARVFNGFPLNLTQSWLEAPSIFLDYYLRGAESADKISEAFKKLKLSVFANVSI
jgi:hypothetical protein